MVIRQIISFREHYFAGCFTSILPCDIIIYMLLPRRSARWHTIYSIISTIVEEAGIALGFLWLLPMFGISVPVWGVALIMAGFAAFSYLMYRLGHPTISYKEMNAPDSIVGCTAVVEGDLDPDGWVKVNGELWRVTCVGSKAGKGDEVIVVGIEGLKLTVEKKAVRPSLSPFY
jgi:membrane protein implicated in regulation of membrane protease activity